MEEELPKIIKNNELENNSVNKQWFAKLYFLVPI